MYLKFKIKVYLSKCVSLSFYHDTLFVVFVWVLLAADELEDVGLLLLIIFMLANKDHDLGCWEVADQLLLSHLED